ncbi:MAG: trypsin-like peptidase domain-containing protein [Elusimicrobia bacterium]|nr:trypsin-like peptidase domain-containing protein [Elusimicrobiota bacterium]
MRRARATLVLLLAASLPIRAETTSDPLWSLLASAVLPADEAAAREAGDGSDAKGLAGLQADLQLLSEGLESFRDEAQVKVSLVRLEPRVAPAIRPYFRDRATSLRTIYRTLAVVDYTWAKRFPEPPCEPERARRRLLVSDDGLFCNADGTSAPWLVSLLGSGAAGKSAEAALDKASAKKKLDEAAYALRRAQIRRLTLALASDKAVGAARSKLYCARADAFEDLAESQVPLASHVLASRASGPAPEAAVYFVDGARRAAATLLRVNGEFVLLTDARAVEGIDRAKLRSRSEEQTAAVLRRDATLGLAILSFSGEKKTPALVLSKNNPSKNDLVSAIGHDDVAGHWTKTSGLVTKAGAVSFQTDAAISAGFTGGPVLDGAGEVAGVLVSRAADVEEKRWPVAVPAQTLARWLDGPIELSVSEETIENAGTAAILTKAGPSGLTETGLGAWNIGSLPPPPGEPRSVCVSRCGGGSSYSGSSSYSSGGEELGQALGQLGAQLILKGLPALFQGIGKLFSKKPKASAVDQLVDNRRRSPPTETPKPPPDPLKPSSLSLSVSRTSLAQGEEVEAVATVGFTGKDGGRSGHSVSFTVVPGGKLNCPPGATDAGGIARVKCQAIIIEGDRTFDALQDETRRRLGLKTPERIKRKPAKNDPIGALKERAEGSQDKLVIEEEKQPMTGTDTPGLDKTISAEEPEEYVVKGDRVTLSGTLGSLSNSTDVIVHDRPCSNGAKLVESVGGILKCISENGNEAFRSEVPDEDDIEKPERRKGKPSVGFRPENTPTGTIPIDQAGLTTEEIHRIKKRLQAGAAEWVGVTPDKHIITSEDGEAVDNGPMDRFNK